MHQYMEDSFSFSQCVALFFKEFNIKKLTKKQKEELIKKPDLLNKFLGDKIEAKLYKRSRYV